MALSTRAKIAGIGGALALGLLGATGYAYAADGTDTTSYVTTVDDGTSTAPSATPSERRGTDRDCPQKGGSTGPGSGGSGPSGSPTVPAPDPADA
jgi:hypothetical protein